MPINVTPTSGLSDHINDIRLRTARIVNEEILPNEATLWAGRRGQVGDEERAQGKALREKIQARVKSEGLWAPHLPPEYGGMGIDFMAHAYMNEILAYAVGAASLFGVVAPNSGNQTILAKYGTKEQKEKWLIPLVEGTMQSGFSMTEPDNAGSDPRRIRTSAVREGDEWVINGHKWFTSNGLAADFFIVMCRAAEAGDDERPGRMMQVIVPTSTPGVTIVRGIGIWGSLSSDHCEVLYENVRVPGGERPGPGGRRSPRRAGPTRCGAHLPLHEFGRPDVARLRPDGRTHAHPRGPRRAVERQAVHAGVRRRQLHGHPVGPAHDDPRSREGGPGGPSGTHGDLLHQGLRPGRLPRVVDRAIQVWGAAGVSNDLPLANMYLTARTCALPTGPTRYTASSSRRTCCSTTRRAAVGTSPAEVPTRSRGCVTTTRLRSLRRRHEQRDLAAGLLLVLVIGRIGSDGALPPRRLLVTGDLPDAHVERLRPIL